MNTDKQQFILALTGPTGSGKSTIAEKLAKSLNKCTYIEVDHIKHMIVSGFSYELNSDGTKEWSYDQWELVGQSIGILAQNFLHHGYDVIICGYLPEEAWIRIEDDIEISHKVLLWPQAQENYERDASRSEDFRLGQATIDTHRQYFTSTDYFKGFTKLDTSGHSLDESLYAIERLLKS